MSDTTPTAIGAAVRPKSSQTARVEVKDGASRRAKRAALGSLDSRHEAPIDEPREQVRVQRVAPGTPHALSVEAKASAPKRRRSRKA